MSLAAQNKCDIFNIIIQNRKNTRNPISPSRKKNRQSAVSVVFSSSIYRSFKTNVVINFIEEEGGIASLDISTLTKQVFQIFKLPYYHCIVQCQCMNNVEQRGHLSPVKMTSYWPSTFFNLTPQVINHIPRANGLCKKDSLARALQKMRHVFGSVFDFMWVWLNHR